MNRPSSSTHIIILMPRVQIVTGLGVLQPEPAQGQEKDARGITPSPVTFAGMHPARSVISQNSPLAARYDADVPGRRSFGSRPIPGSCRRGRNGKANGDTGSGHGTHGLGTSFLNGQSEKRGRNCKLLKKRALNCRL